LAVPVVSSHDAVQLQGHAAPQPPHGDELVVVGGGVGADVFVLNGEVTSVGRHEASDVLLDDVSVSRHHAVFTRTASGRVTVRDLNSLNGTYVNGQRVEETTLRSADEIQIGKFKLVFWQAAQ
jgi:pSer/pThr/pTyr-binding forkhead associated (FHA) protein